MTKVYVSIDMEGVAGVAALRLGHARHGRLPRRPPAHDEGGECRRDGARTDMTARLGRWS